MTEVIESDYVMNLCALNMRADRFFLVYLGPITFWQIIRRQRTT